MTNIREIQALALLQNQQRWVDLGQIKPTEKAFALAHREMQVIEKLPGWENPVMIRVRPQPGCPQTFDGVKFADDGTALVYIWQYQALARFLELVDPLPLPKPEEPADKGKLPAAEVNAQVMNTAIARIEAIRREIKNANAEFRELDRMADAARNDLLEASNLSMPMPKARQKIADANATLDLVQSRRKRFSGLEDESVQQLLAHADDLLGAWNSHVANVRNGLECLTVAGTAWVFGGERQATRFWESSNLNGTPGFASCRRAYYPEDTFVWLQGAPSRQLVSAVECLVGHVRRYAPAMGVELTITQK